MQSYFVKRMSLCCAVVVSLFAHAQSVEELCKEHVSHLGGKAAVEKVRTIKMQQVTPEKVSPTMVYTYSEPGKIYFQRKRSRELTLTTCATLKEAWNHSSYPVSETQSLSTQAKKTLLLQSKFYGPLYDYAVHGDSSDVASVSLGGTVDVDGVPCYALNVVYKSGNKAQVDIAKKDYMIKRIISPIGVLKYGDYRTVSGLKLPYHLESYTRQGSIVLDVFRTDINSTINHQELERPKQ